ncbi:cytochrome P450 [Streptomyces sp. NRRL F-5123]|uniref:cytochrome P450 n=1 Tax=Streptomyces sp. NRRL F-5123 TaxID=1463856 RepID=UPI000AEF5645|nr:cytochrome P450 [Streptomyces sp. NRRL F-5123]
MTAAPQQAQTPDPAALALEMLAPGGREDPYPLYARALEMGPVLDVGGGLYLVTGYDAVNRALRNPAFGVTGAQASPEDRDAHDAIGLLARSVLENDPPEHTRMRALMNSVFTPRRIAAYEPMVAEVVGELLDSLAESGADGAPVDFMTAFASPLPLTVICEMLGVPAADRHLFRTLAADLTIALEFVADPAMLLPADAAAVRLAGYFGDLVAERRAHPRESEDLVGALLAARDAGDGRLSEGELLANLTLLLVAGFETTTDLLGNGLRLLFDHPEAAAGLRAGRIEVGPFVEEVLRYESPVQLTSRIVHADGQELAGVPLPRGAQLVLLVGAANRDPARYPDPERFDPTRTASRPLSFGAGAHVCIGNGLARLEAAVAFPLLLARFPHLAPADTPPTRRDRVVLRGHGTFPVRVTQGVPVA